MKAAMIATVFILTGLAGGLIGYNIPHNGGGKSILYSKIPPENINDAHQLSVNFWNKMGWCNTPPVATMSNYFDVSYRSIQDMFAAAVAAQSVPQTDNFRVIFGYNTSSQKTKLILVGLDNSGKMENISKMYTIDGDIDCPINCDYKNSRIIMGDGSTNQNQCK